MVTDQPKRRWNQFSLMTLLVVVTVSTVAFGGWVQYMRHWAQENRDRLVTVEEAVAAIEELGGKVTSEYKELRSRTWLEKQFDDPGPSGNPVRILQVKVVDLVLLDVTDTDLERLTTLKDFASLSLNGKNVTQVDLESLKGAANRAQINRKRVAPHEKALAEIDKRGGKWAYGETPLRPQTWLERLFDDPGGADDPVAITGGTFVFLRSDDGLAHLKRLTDLLGLDLGSSSVIDAGLKHLKELADLEELELGSPNITDAGLKHLQGLANLKKLELRSPKLTDAGLEHLKGLESLQTLVFFDTKVTDEGVEQLRQALPNCRISITSGVIVAIEKLGGKFERDRSNAIVSVTLSNSRVSDAELEQLKGLMKLQHLDLNDSSITDAGLKHLKGLTNLEELWLLDTNVTDEGAETLQHALPNCVIYHQ